MIPIHENIIFIHPKRYFMSGAHGSIFYIWCKIMLSSHIFKKKIFFLLNVPFRMDFITWSPFILWCTNHHNFLVYYFLCIYNIVYKVSRYYIQQEKNDTPFCKIQKKLSPTKKKTVSIKLIISQHHLWIVQQIMTKNE